MRFANYVIRIVSPLKCDTHMRVHWGQSSLCAAVVGVQGCQGRQQHWVCPIPAEPTGSSEQGPSGAGGDGSRCLHLSTASHLNTYFLTIEYKITQRWLILTYIIFSFLRISRPL